jgi:hypothetical protein
MTTNTRNNGITFRHVFYAIRAVSKETRRLVFPERLVLQLHGCEFSFGGAVYQEFHSLKERYDFSLHH